LKAKDRRVGVKRPESARETYSSIYRTFSLMADALVELKRIGMVIC
jgi:hypothetical protein